MPSARGRPQKDQALKEGPSPGLSFIYKVRNIQPADKESCWRYKLSLPKTGGLTLDQVASAIEHHAGSLRQFNAPGAANDSEPPSSKSETATAAILSGFGEQEVATPALDSEKEDAEPERTTPQQFLDDPMVIATALCEFLQGSLPTALESHIRAELTKDFGWTEAETMQAMIGLEAHGYIRRVTRDDGYLYVELVRGSKICHELTQAGYVKPVPRLVTSSDASAPVGPKSGLRKQIAELTQGKSVQRVRPGESGLQASPRPAPKPVTRAVSSPGGVAPPTVETGAPSRMFDMSNFDRLMDMSEQRQDAMRELPELTSRTELLRADLNAAREALDRLTTEFATAEAARAKTAAIADDPDFMAADLFVSRILERAAKRQHDKP